VSDIVLTERDEDGASIDPGDVPPGTDAHSPDNHETQSPRASPEPRRNDVPATFQSSVLRPVDAPFGHQVQPPVLRPGYAPSGQNYGSHVPQRNLQPPMPATKSNFFPQYPPSYAGNRDSYERPIYGQNAFGHMLAPNPSFYPPQFYFDVPPTAWPSFNEPCAKRHMNFMGYTPGSYHHPGWNNQYPSPHYFTENAKDFYPGAQGHLWIPPNQSSYVHPVTSSSVVTRSKKPSRSEKASSNTPPQPRKPRLIFSSTPTTMEIPSVPAVSSTPTLPPITPTTVPSSKFNSKHAFKSRSGR